MRRYALPVLAAVVIALAGWLAWLWWTPPYGPVRDVHWEPPLARRTDFSSMAPPVPAAEPVDTGRFIATLDRPLFAATRRPPLPPPPPAPPPPPPPVDHLASARIQGIFDIPGQGGSIIVNVGGKSRRVRVNEAVEGWTVKSIAGSAVTLARGEQTRVLQLQRAAVASYTGLAPQASAPAARAAAVPTAAGSPSGRPQAAAPERNDAPPARAVFGGSAR